VAAGVALREDSQVTTGINLSYYYLEGLKLYLASNLTSNESNYTVGDADDKNYSQTTSLLGVYWEILP